jgi:hypothetical protein
MHTIDHADDRFLASKRAAYHRRIWPAGARATARRAWARAQRRHGRELCRQALDRESWADDGDFEEMLHQQDLAEDYEEILERRAERVADARRMREMALATLAADAELWSGIENKY